MGIERNINSSSMPDSGKEISRRDFAFRYIPAGLISLVAGCTPVERIFESPDATAPLRISDTPSSTTLPTETSTRTPSATSTQTETPTPTNTPTPDIQATRLAIETEYDRQFYESGIQFSEALTSRSELFTVKISQAYADRGKVAEFRITNEDVMNLWGSALLFPFAFKQAVSLDGTPMDALVDYMEKHQITLAEYDRITEAVQFLKNILLDQKALINISINPSLGIVSADRTKQTFQNVKFDGLDIAGSVRRVDIRILRKSEFDALEIGKDSAHMKWVYYSSTPGGGGVSEVLYRINSDVLQIAYSYISNQPSPTYRQSIVDPNNWETLKGPITSDSVFENRISMFSTAIKVISLYNLAASSFSQNDYDSVPFLMSPAVRGGLNDSDIFNPYNYIFRGME